MIFTAHTAFAQSFAVVREKSPATVEIVNKIMAAIVFPVVQGLFVLTMLLFIWGVVTMIRHGDDPAARKTGQQHVLWGAVGMFIIVSAYGIIRVIGYTVGVGDPFQ